MFEISLLIFTCGLIVIGVMIARKAQRVSAKATPTSLEFEVAQKRTDGTDTQPSE
jgi:hypothetical protein